MKRSRSFYLDAPDELVQMIVHARQELNTAALKQDMLHEFLTRIIVYEQNDSVQWFYRDDEYIYRLLAVYNEITPMWRAIEQITDPRFRYQLYSIIGDDDEGYETDDTMLTDDIDYAINSILFY